MDANDAASYVQELTGEDANIIFGAMYDDSVADYARITVIATGLTEAAKSNNTFGGRSSNASFGMKRPTVNPAPNSAMSMPSFQPAQYECNTVQHEGSLQHCSEKGHPDSGFPEKSLRLPLYYTKRQSRRTEMYGGFSYYQVSAPS